MPKQEQLCLKVADGLLRDLCVCLRAIMEVKIMCPKNHGIVCNTPQWAPGQPRVGARSLRQHTCVRAIAFAESVDVENGCEYEIGQKGKQRNR